MLTRALHERAIQRIKETIDAAAGADEKMRRRLVVQVGTPRAFEDVDSLLRILVLRDVLGDLARRLPKHLRTFEREQIDQVKALVEAAAAQKSPDLAARKTDIFVCGLVLVIGRLALPWQLIRLATRAAESDDAARVAETPFADAVAIVLSEIECMVSELRVELKARRPVTSLLKGIHDAARGLRTEMDLSADSPWSSAARRDPHRHLHPAQGRDRNRHPGACGACCGRGRPMRSRPAHCSTQST